MTFNQEHFVLRQRLPRSRSCGLPRLRIDCGPIGVNNVIKGRRELMRKSTFQYGWPSLRTGPTPRLVDCQPGCEVHFPSIRRKRIQYCTSGSNL